MIPMSVKPPSLLAAGAATVLLAAGCSTDGAGDGDRLQVVAGFYPLEWTAARVGGNLVEVTSLTPPGAEAHDLELTPQDVGAITDADLLVHLEGFQPAVDDAAASQAADTAWDAGAAADLIPAAGGAEHAAEHGGEAADDHDEEHGQGLDPHFWLDPTRLADVGDALAGRLAELDPDSTEVFERNAADLRADLEALDAEIADALADCRVDTLVTAHEAFGYLGDRYGLEVVGISGISPSQEPDPAALAEIADLVEERGVTTVYTETLVDPAVAETVAAEAGVDTAVLDPIEGLTDAAAGDDYLDVLRADAEVLREGQSCS
jgi:zinc transport system substrate-binding protein